MVIDNNIEESEWNVRLKSLKRLENLLKGSKVIYEKDYNRAVRTKDGTLDTRTHNIDLTPGSNIIQYEGSQSKWFFYEFENNSKALEWWCEHINPLIVDA